jgi:hypothetical protein
MIDEEKQMVILMDGDGRKCDEKCYNAKRIGCHCICGGHNHGLGLEHALKTAHDLQEAADEREEMLDLAEEYTEDKINYREVNAIDDAEQDELPDGEIDEEAEENDEPE